MAGRPKLTPKPKNHISDTSNKKLRANFARIRTEALTALDLSPDRVPIIVH